MKVKDFIKNHKFLVVGIVVVVFVALFCLGSFIVRVMTHRKTPYNVYQLVAVPEEYEEILVKDKDVIDQEYKISSIDYSEIGIRLQFLSENPDEKINVKFSCGEKEFNKALSPEDVADEGYTYISIPQEFSDADASVLKMELTTNSTEGVAVLINSNDGSNISKALLNGEEYEGKIILQMRTDKISYGSYFVYFIGFILFLSLLFFLIYKKVKIEVITVVVLAFFGIVCMSIFPPATVPDEPLHYRSAYHVSNMMMFNFGDEPSSMYMRSEDNNYLWEFSNHITNENYRFTAKNSYVFCKDKTSVKTSFGYMTNKAAVYFVPAFGISLARIFGLSAFWTFQIGRIFNYALFIAMIYYAIKLMPFGKQMLAIVAMLPVNIHIMASNSYDVFTTGGVFLMFAYIMHLMYDDKLIEWKQLLILAIMIALVVPQKIVYIGVAAIVLIIPKERFKQPKWHLGFKCLLGLVAVASIFVLQLGSVAKATSDTVSSPGAAAGYGLSYVLKNPLEIGAMFVNTVYELSDFYIKSLVAFFGWFEIDIPWFLVIGFLAILLLSFMRKEDEPEALKPASAIYAGILFAIIWLMTEFILLLDHTPMGSSVVGGVQGRYFIPALPLLFLLIRNNRITLKKDISGQLMLAAGVMDVIIFNTAIIAIFMHQVVLM